jgi:hypothetical protein
VAFLPTSEEAICKQNDIAKAVAITTKTIPTNVVCFNLTDLFSLPSDTGFKNGSQYGQHQPYYGIHYLLKNRDSYRADVNYTNVWHQQVNVSGNTKPGTDAAFVLHTYVFEDCNTDSISDNMMWPDWPYFDTSCQTKSEGECGQTTQPIRSFEIGPAAYYNAVRGHCAVWTRENGASAVIPRKAVLLVVALAVVLVL